jgi:transcriptional regulator with XRE-family HTH domain
MTTGQKIRMLRDLNKLTQEKLAEKAGVSEQSIYWWENGKRNPEPRSLRDLGKALGVKDEDLL